MSDQLSRAVDDGFAYFESFTNLERDAGAARTPMRLERMRELLSAFGNPQDRFRSIHIAGSKGKGSTGAFMASVLRSLGHRVGFYTSPHVRDYRERIAVDDSYASDAVLQKAFAAIRRYVETTYPDSNTERPTTFELLTLLAFLVFHESGCDWAVVETGLGGRLDATNVLQPQACVLTRIEREHVEYLGDRLEQIAAEKAGIIKAKTPVFSSAQYPEVIDVIRTRASELEAPLFELPAALKLCATSFTPDGMHLRLRIDGFPELAADLRLTGSVQAQNAALAAYALYSLFPKITPATVESGLSAAWLPARGELTATVPPVMIDGAHTPASVEAVTSEFCRLFEAPRTLVFGAVRGKDYRGMAAGIAGAFERVIISRPGQFKPSDLEELAAAFRTVHPRVELCPEAESAWARVRSYGDPALVTGSFYLAAELHAVLDKSRD